MTTSETRDLKRAIGSRQLSMIAIGGAIGTGLFFASGRPSRKPAREAPCWLTRSWVWQCTA